MSRTAQFLLIAVVVLLIWSSMQPKGVELEVGDVTITDRRAA